MKRRTFLQIAGSGTGLLPWLAQSPIAADDCAADSGGSGSSWIPLTAGAPTQAMARRMAEILSSRAWQTPLPLPTVDRTDKRWKSSGLWRGDVWPPTNYQIAGGLAAYGYADLASDICDKTVANAITNGISEHYDSISGKPLGVKDYCMSSTLVTMMLDGLTKTHKLKLRAKNPTL